jgi:lipopolysaccharide/colanic/teichoic acid biosynthesis glycosyltransferase
MPPRKRLFDLVLSVPLAVATLPVLAAVFLANRLDGDRGPLLFRATRVGEGGHPITVLKLRTMVDATGPGSLLTQRNDPRITRIGRFLRKSKIDELPQLWNVVRGDMSLVGPRPEDPAFVDWTNPLHQDVFSARPGITGLAQLAYAREEELHVGSDAVELYRTRILPRKLRLDRWYLDHWRVALDVRILMETAGIFLGGTRRRWRRRRSPFQVGQVSEDA